MRAVGNVVTGGVGGEGLSLPTEETEDREAVRARIEAKAAARRAASPFANYRPSTPTPPPAPADVDDRYVPPPLVDEPALAPATDAAPAAPEAPAAPTPAPKPAPPRSRIAGGSAGVDAAGIVQDYLDGASVPEIARARSHATSTVRRVLKSTPGVVLRDDRATRSGSKPKQDVPEVVAAVRRLYVDEELTQEQVGDRLGLSAKAVQGIMARAGIEARANVVESGVKHNAPGRSTLTGHKAAIAAAGLSSSQLRAWALEHGVPVGAVGVPGKAVLAAYLAAQQPAPEPAPEPASAPEPMSPPAPAGDEAAKTIPANVTPILPPAPSLPVHAVPDPTRPRLTSVPPTPDRIAVALSTLAYRFAEALDDFARQVSR